MGVAEPAWSPAVGTKTARTAFRLAYGAEPDGVWASPGRVNLIGEHTDYNGGLCLPVALPHRTYVAASRRRDGRLRISTTLPGGGDPQRWEGDLGDVQPGRVGGWVAYAAGPAWALREDGVGIPGADLAVVSCVPLGAGLSSSAAIECATGLALADLAGQPLDGDDEARVRLTRLCVAAENEVAGAPTGGMDQAASLRTRAGHALLLDCRDGSAEHIPLDLDTAGLRLLVIDTRAAHSLGDGQYGRRRATCEAAAFHLGVTTLGEIADLDAALVRLDDREMRDRTRHVVTEIRRVRDLVVAARAGDWAGVGALMTASHASLRDDYEVSCLELDTAVEAARSAGALGARMTGGGFGGSAIALVRATDAGRVRDAVLAAAAGRGVVEPDVHVATPAGPGCRME